jgi:hypothetical protein
LAHTLTIILQHPHSKAQQQAASRELQEEEAPWPRITQRMDHATENRISVAIMKPLARWFVCWPKSLPDDDDTLARGQAGRESVLTTFYIADLWF